MKKPNCLFGLVVAMSIFSCSGDRLFEEFHGLESQVWNEQDTAKFEIQGIPQSSSSKLIGVRYNESYPFTNFYVRILAQDSTGATLQDVLINVPLFDSKSGKPKGGGFGNTFTLYDTLPFDLSEQATRVLYLQYMRQSDLPGIEAVGLKIVK